MVDYRSLMWRTCLEAQTLSVLCVEYVGKNFHHFPQMAETLPSELVERVVVFRKNDPAGRSSFMQTVQVIHSQEPSHKTSVVDTTTFSFLGNTTKIHVFQYSNLFTPRQLVDSIHTTSSINMSLFFYNVVP